jgi:hypothetical protein
LLIILYCAEAHKQDKATTTVKIVFFIFLFLNYKFILII